MKTLLKSKFFIAALAILFSTNATKAQWTDDGGSSIYTYTTDNVGIGTITPSQALTVVGRTSIAPSGTTPNDYYNGNLVVTKPQVSGQYINLIRQATYAWSLGMVYNTSDFAIGAGKTTDSEFSNPFFVIKSTGNVGIGTTNPVSPLHVYRNDATTNASSGITIEQDGAGDAKLQYLLTGARRWVTGIDNSDDDKFIIGCGDDWLVGKHLTIDTLGKVGIGTTTPGEKLDVNGTVHITNGLMFGSAFAPDQAFINNNGNYISFGHPGVSEDFIGYRDNTFFLRDSPGGGDTSQPNLMIGGNVGIGTTSANAKLDVGAFLDGGSLGTVLGRLEEGNTTGDGTFLGVKGYGTQPANGKSFSIEHHFFGQTNSSINFFRGGSYTGGFITFNTNNNSEKMRINTNGNVSIGTTALDPTGALLTVNGTIHAREIIVDLNIPLADYVFNSNYTLMPLSEVEQFVKTNSHLPEMPSAQDVKENGLNMGEMQNKLLQKVEEITLYMIAQEKTIKDLKKEIEILQNK